MYIVLVRLKFYMDEIVIGDLKLGKYALLFMYEFLSNS